MHRKSLSLLSIVLSCAAFSGCNLFSADQAESDDITNQRGVIERLDSQIHAVPPVTVFIIELEDDPAARYKPINLPEAFQRDSLRVVFSGNIKDPHVVDIYCTRLEITHIEELR